MVCISKHLADDHQSGDGITLPGMLDLESGTSEGYAECWGLSASAMVSWISDFVTEYHTKTTRYPVIYTSPSWWEDCTGNSNAFVDLCPLDMAEWASSMGAAPGGELPSLYKHKNNCS